MISDEALLDDIHEVSETVGRTPSYDEMVEHTSYSMSTYQRRFDTWRNSVIEAGLTPLQNPQTPLSDVSKSDISSKMEEMKEESGEVPSSREFEETEYGRWHIEKLFGSWNEALEYADLEPNMRMDISEKKLREEISRLEKELGNVPSTSDMAKHGKYDPETYRRKLDGWNSTLRQMGLVPTVQSDLSDDELLRDMEELHDNLGKIPTMEEFNTHMSYNAAIFGYRFGTYSNAIKKSDIPSETVRFIQNFNGSLEQLRKIIYRGYPEKFERQSVFLQEDAEGICEMCESENTKLDTHHIIPALADGPNSKELLMPLCPPCHAKAERWTRQNITEYSAIPRLIEENSP